MALDRLALVVTLGVFAGLAVYRAVHLWLTGFYVSDEFSYLMTAIDGSYYHWGHTFHVNRPFFLAVNSFLVRSLGITTGSAFAIFLPFYLMLWNSITVLSAYGILKTLDLDRRTIAASLLGMLSLVSLLVLDQGFITEPVSLSMAMLGVFLLQLFAKSQRPASIVFPFLAAFAFGAAAYTHEPFQIFLYLGWVPVIFISIRRAIRLRQLPMTRRLHLAITPTLLLILASFLLLLVVAGYMANYLRPVVTYYGNIPQEETLPVAAIIAGGWNVQRVLNTFAAFIEGLLLGWNPIMFSLAFAGFLLLLPKLVARGRSDVHVMAFACGAISFLQFLIVCAFMAGTPQFTIPTFFLLGISASGSLGNLSTIIRYSQMAVPAYFVSTPFSLSRIGRKSLAAVFVLLIIFGVAAAGPYQQYMQTHLSYGYPYSAGQPIFELSYRTPLARLRDYVAAHPNDGPFIVFAEANPKSYYDNFTLHWQMIPGTEHLPPVKFYPYPSESEFLSMKPSRFYIYGEGDGAINRVADKAPYLVAFLQPTQGENSAMPYEVTRIEAIHQGTDAFIILVELSWNN
jgi:hypothetical protein